MDTPVLAVRHVSKSFAGVRALVDIDLDIAPGEIHCLAGENGSGKSTLIKVISGVHTPEQGTVSIGGREFTRLTPADAIDAGVRVIYQDFSLSLIHIWTRGAACVLRADDEGRRARSSIP